MSIKTVVDSKTIEELQADKPVASVEPKELTDEKVEVVLTCLKYQGGCSATEGNEEFIGLGDGQIALKAGLTLDQVREIKTAKDAKVAELTAPKVVAEPIAEITK